MDVERDEYDDSDVEEALPPDDLVAQVREILARPVRLHEVARVWDSTGTALSREERVTACLDHFISRLLDGEYAVEAEHAPRAAAAGPAVAAAATTSSPAPAARTVDPGSPVLPTPPRANNRFIDLSQDTPDSVQAGPSRSPNDRTAAEARRKASSGNSTKSLRDDRAVQHTNAATRSPGSSPPKRKRDHYNHDLDDRSEDSDAFSAGIQAKRPRRDPLFLSKDPDEDLIHGARTDTGIRADSSTKPAGSTASTSTNKRASPVPNGARSQLQAGTSAAGAAGVAAEPKPAPVEEATPAMQVLAIIPDVDIEHVNRLLEAAVRTDPGQCVEHVINSLLAHSKYPRASDTAKVKDEVPKAKVQTLDEQYEALLNADKRRTSEAYPLLAYREAAIEYLNDAFPSIPVPFIRQTYTRNSAFWAPTHHELQLFTKSTHPPYHALKAPRKGKGRQAALEQDDSLVEERRIYFAKLAGDKAKADAIARAELLERQQLAEDEHFFCMECARKNSEHILGVRGSEITCMHESGCKLSFSADECAKFMNPPQLLLLDKIRSEKAVELAGLEGVSYCPHCSFGCLIENPNEKLFYCLAQDCRKITCRGCKKPNHLPKSCAEYAADLKTDTLHLVEEAMTEALIKRCPKCETPVYKSDGCNKMTCSKCHIFFCYSCGKQIQGYEHFVDGRTAGARTAGTGDCKVFDDTRMREYETVEAARQAAIAKIRQDKGDPEAQVSEEELEKLGLKKPEPTVNPQLAAQQAHAAAVQVHQAALQAHQAAAQARAAQDAAAQAAYRGAQAGQAGPIEPVQLPQWWPAINAQALAAGNAAGVDLNAFFQNMAAQPLPNARAGGEAGGQVPVQAPRRRRA